MKHLERFSVWLFAMRIPHDLKVLAANVVMMLLFARAYLLHHEGQPWLGMELLMIASVYVTALFVRRQYRHVSVDRTTKLRGGGSALLAIVAWFGTFYLLDFRTVAAEATDEALLMAIYLTVVAAICKWDAHKLSRADASDEVPERFRAWLLERQDQTVSVNSEAPPPKRRRSAEVEPVVHEAEFVDDGPPSVRTFAPFMGQSDFERTAPPNP